MASNGKYIVEEFVQLSQTWKPAGGKKKILPQLTLKEAQQEAARMIKRMEAANIKAERDLRPKSYGSVQIPRLRIVKYVDKTKKSVYAGTKKDLLLIKKQPELKKWFKL